jgi:hypothetical protein
MPTISMNRPKYWECMHYVDVKNSVCSNILDVKIIWMTKCENTVDETL